MTEPRQIEGKAGPLIGVKAMSKILRGILEVATGITPPVKAQFQDEALCRRCGVCCLSGVRIKDKIVLLRELPCKYLAFEPDGLASCSVYPSRELTGWCHRVGVESVRRELFAADCPYVQGIPRYGGKIELSPEEFNEIKPILRNVFKLLAKPEYLRLSDWNRFRHDVLGLEKP